MFFAINLWNRFCCRQAQKWMEKLIIEDPAPKTENKDKTWLIQTTITYLNILEKEHFKKE